ncbi:hypothetical protein [Micromonospora sp. 15K316]|uniref:hypothetical protein n=1 Tax=Micromonospora sp. 15K316 TaxID=2530376 RepID=UPI0014047364|nr:hypothetical protein [Micromonospora sp. 15K316]
MACSCGKNRKQFEVVVNQNGVDKVVFTGSVKTTADTVSKRYPGSTVREKAPAAAK